MRDFIYEQAARRVIFGVGSLSKLPEEIRRLGKRALILSTPEQRKDAENVSAQLGDLSVGVFTKAVIYDPTLTITLPARIAGPSGMNAIAHCVEALYAPDGNPIISLMAAEGIRALARALPTVVREQTNLDARSDALYGAWLAGIS